MLGGVGAGRSTLPATRLDSVVISGIPLTKPTDNPHNHCKPKAKIPGPNVIHHRGGHHPGNNLALPQDAKCLFPASLLRGRGNVHWRLLTRHLDSFGLCQPPISAQGYSCVDHQQHQKGQEELIRMGQDAHVRRSVQRSAAAAPRQCRKMQTGRARGVRCLRWLGARFMIQLWAELTSNSRRTRAHRPPQALATRLRRPARRLPR